MGLKTDTASRSKMVRLRGVPPRVGRPSANAEIRYGQIAYPTWATIVDLTDMQQTFACKKCKKCFRKDAQEFEERLVGADSNCLSLLISLSGK